MRVPSLQRRICGVRTYSDIDVAEELGNYGVPLDAYSLVGEAPHELPAFWLPEIGFRYLVIEDDELSRACADFLARRGARRFRDAAEMLSAACSERWPGWDSRSAADRFSSPPI